jgi:hypothetical protein
VAIQRLALDLQRLEVAAAGVAGAAEHEHPAVGVAEERLDGVAAQVRVDGHHVGAVAVEGLTRVLLGGAADVAPLGVEHQQHPGVPMADMSAQLLEFALRADRSEVGDLWLERAHHVGGGVDDGGAEVEHRAVHCVGEAGGVGVEAHAEHRARAGPCVAEMLVERHAPTLLRCR